MIIDMAAVPNVTARGRAPVARVSDSKLWWTAAAVGALACVAYGVIPAEHDLLRGVIIFPATEAAAIAAVVYGVHRHRPHAPAAWLLLAGGFASWLIGDLIWGVHIVRNQEPSPSIADLFYLSGYPLMGAGLLVAVRRRRDFVDARATLDTALVTVVGLLLTWIILVRPLVVDDTLGAWETYVSCIYPVGDLLLLCITTRFLLGASWNVLALRLLTFGLAATLVGDALFNLEEAGRIRPISFDDTVLLVGVVCVGLAGLHHTMTSLTEEQGQPSDADGPGRLALLLAICLAPVAVLIVQDARDAYLYISAVTASLILIAVLTVARFTSITNRALRAVERETVLSEYAEELLRSHDRDALFALAEQKANELLRPNGRAVLVADPQDAPDDRYAFRAPVQVRGEQVAELVADAGPLTIRQADDSLEQIATELSLALERELLLDSEREHATALAEQNERLLEVDRMKDAFVSSVSHELRTPLTSMIGYLEILRGPAGVDLSETQRAKFLEIVDRNSHRLNKLIEDILVTSRMDSGRFKLVQEEVDLGALVSERAESIRTTAEQSNVVVRLEVAEQLPSLTADPMRLGQVIDNLLSNAVKFTTDGGTVGVTVTGDDGTLQLTVSDTGVGIPEDEVGRLFERFYRASTATEIQGTGLGLSISKGIIEAHGGTITVASELGIGSTFTVSLPIRSPLASEPATEAAA